MITDYRFSIQDALIPAGPIECMRILLSAASSCIRRRHIEGARDFARYWIGAKLAYRSGLENYMARFWGLPAGIGLKFAEKRKLWIAEYASVPNRSRRILKPRPKSTRAQPTNQQLAPPKEGFGSLYEFVIRRLKANGATFVLGSQPASLNKKVNGYELQVGGQRYTASRVESPIPTDRMLRICDIPSDKPLPGVTLLTLFFSLSGSRAFPPSIFYNVVRDGSRKRLTVYLNFYKETDCRQYVARDVIAGQGSESAQLEAAAFRQYTSKNGLLTGDLRLEGSHTLTSAYPFYTKGTGDRSQQAIMAPGEFGVEPFGRQGGLHYQPTARVSTVEAQEALNAHRLIRSAACSHAHTDLPDRSGRFDRSNDTARLGLTRDTARLSPQTPQRASKIPRPDAALLKRKQGPWIA